MILSTEELRLIQLARIIATNCVNALNMASLNDTVKVVMESKINILLLFMSDTEFNEAIK